VALQALEPLLQDHRREDGGNAVVHPRLDLIHGLNINTPGGDGYSQLGFTASSSDTLRHCEDLLAMLIAGRAAEQIVVEVVRRF